jgi:hypothetical protein
MLYHANTDALFSSFVVSSTHIFLQASWKTSFALSSSYVICVCSLTAGIYQDMELNLYVVKPRKARNPVGEELWPNQIESPQQKENRAHARLDSVSFPVQTG